MPRGCRARIRPARLSRRGRAGAGATCWWTRQRALKHSGRRPTMMPKQHAHAVATASFACTCACAAAVCASGASRGDERSLHQSMSSQPQTPLHDTHRSCHPLVAQRKASTTAFHLTHRVWRPCRRRIETNCIPGEGSSACLQFNVCACVYE